MLFADDDEEEAAHPPYTLCCWSCCRAEAQRPEIVKIHTYDRNCSIWLLKIYSSEDVIVNPEVIQLNLNTAGIHHRNKKTNYWEEVSWVRQGSQIEDSELSSRVFICRSLPRSTNKHGCSDEEVEEHTLLCSARVSPSPVPLIRRPIICKSRTRLHHIQSIRHCRQ